tara:strand:+ start:52 stop:615 length:564 start_codon:yes stop_codon:yes gene_type:complete
MKKNIAVFSSGRGGNFDNICKYFKNHNSIKIKLLITNNPESTSTKIADRHQIKVFFADKSILKSQQIIEILNNESVQLLVLSGFILKIPKKIISTFPKKIINLHPSLLPNFGGKGMYGDNVHRAVLKANEKITGVTIHFVDEIYDNGEIVAQEKCNIDDEEDLSSLREKIRKLEYSLFPKTIEKILS